MIDSHQRQSQIGKVVFLTNNSIYRSLSRYNIIPSRRRTSVCIKERWICTEEVTVQGSRTLTGRHIRARGRIWTVRTTTMRYSGSGGRRRIFGETKDLGESAQSAFMLLLPFLAGIVINVRFMDQQDARHWVTQQRQKENAARAVNFLFSSGLLLATTLVLIKGTDLLLPMPASRTTSYHPSTYCRPSATSLAQAPHQAW